MAYDRFFIGPLNKGQETNLKPFFIPEDAFEQLNNAYVFRGRVRKRFGTRVMNTTALPHVAQQYTRLRIAVPGGAGIGITDGGGNAAGWVPNGIAALPGFTGAVGQMFSIGDEFYTVVNPAAGVLPMLATLGAATYDVSTGAYAFVGAPATTQIYFYPSLPVMGFTTYLKGQINSNPVFAFDTKFSYQFAGGSWLRLGTEVWSGSDSQFFWGCSWHGATGNIDLLFVTNFNQPDQLKYWDGAIWTTFNPVIDAAAHTLETARVLIVFKDRLIAFNTIENIGGMVFVNFFNRARYSQNGSPIAVDAWREDIPGKGDYLDCPCKEQIVTAQIIKDRLIVYFESSTWEFVYTGNEVLPFRWQQINSELGAQSTFSQVPFDKVLLGIGNVGIHACNGANVERIDEKIPDAIFKVHGYDDGPKRVAGIRDYYVEMVYWSFPSTDKFSTATQKFPNRVLVFNYRTGSWAFNDDSITAFGYYDQQDATTWVSSETWDAMTDTWGSGMLATHPRQIVAGNQEGFTFLVDVDNPTNSISLQITDIDVATSQFTVINHNLNSNDYVRIESVQGTTGLNENVYKVLVIDDNTVSLQEPLMLGVYRGGGTMHRVSVLDIITKQYNLYLDKGRNAAIPKVDFLVDKEYLGEVTVFCYPSYSYKELVGAGAGIGVLIGTSVLELHPYVTVPLEDYQKQLWHSVYFQAEGESVQFRIGYTHDQMLDGLISRRDFQLHAFIIYAMPTSSRLQ